MYTDHQGTDDQSPAVPPISVHQCQLSVLIHATSQCPSVAHQCHISVHISPTYQCPSELPFSVTHQCQCHPSVPASATYQ
ncbi:unnamed protein product, partial [Staurois parvus]